VAAWISLRRLITFTAVRVHTLLAFLHPSHISISYIPLLPSFRPNGASLPAAAAADAPDNPDAGRPADSPSTTCIKNAARLESRNTITDMAAPPATNPTPAQSHDIVKVNNANLVDLKNACDDALKRVRIANCACQSMFV
jgi:hypothetical protein